MGSFKAMSRDHLRELNDWMRHGPGGGGDGLNLNKKTTTANFFTFKRADRDGDGFIDFVDVLSLLYPQANKDHLQWMREVAYPIEKSVDRSAGTSSSTEKLRRAAP